MKVPDQRSTAATFADLALPLFDQLYNFAHWLTQNASEAEDLVQETYVKALRGFSGFQAGTNFRAWIFRILRNAFLNSRSGSRLCLWIPTRRSQLLMHLPRKRRWWRRRIGKPFGKH